MAFIQVQQSLVTHRKTLRLARLLGENRYAVVGRLVALWTWCLDNAPDHDIDADVLADVMGWVEQQGKPAELFEALITAGFIDMDPHDLHLSIHDWYDHKGRFIEKLEEKRTQDADRKRRQREREREAASARRSRRTGPTRRCSSC